MHFYRLLNNIEKTIKKQPFATMQKICKYGLTEDPSAKINLR